MNKVISFFLLIIVLFSFVGSQEKQDEKTTLCITFDDGSTKDFVNYKNEVWNKMILQHLENHNLKSILYVAGKNLDSPEGKAILETWDSAGHLIANHTYGHLNYNSSKMTFEKYEKSILRCDSLINSYEHYVKFFRAPYLKRGETVAKRDSLINFLKNINYKNGYVTIDASDWFVNTKLIKFMKANPGESIEGYKKCYIAHLMERAKFYDDLAYELTGRRIKHSLLLHHNLTSALFLGDLIAEFKKEGWNFINAKETLTDEIYNHQHAIIPAGESIVWSIAKESEKYDDILRYPAEDSKYEEENMNKLVLCQQ
ncbi:MAG: polysaccharide deacetylase family protein [Ignavibacteria bacterium]|jgi:peptidoglycan/xylan/chitin deacetylase (PgdA/CDA1 family)